MKVTAKKVKGTRDFNSNFLAKRKYLLSIITSQFELFGFSEIQTPAMENLSTLMGKYGEEGDRLIFKILNSGNVTEKIGEKRASEIQTSELSNKALRYDLTIPFARFVSEHFNELQFPFKRYQVQPVWRADQPQRGRFREFFQCDADVVGSHSLLQEIEFIQLYDKVFSDLKLNVNIKINNRKLLLGLTEALGIGEKFVSFTNLLDKADKIGQEKLQTEMSKIISDENSLNILMSLLKENDITKQIETLESLFKSNENGIKGLEETNYILDYFSQNKLSSQLTLDIKLARGLDYYTGIILEVEANDAKMGSIGGGGRYADLTGVFGKKDLPGVGISFGLERIQLVMEELDLFPKQLNKSSVKILITNFGSTEAFESFKLVNLFRENNISSEVYPDASKLKKQMNYANNKQIPFVLMVGSEELKNQKFVLKNMTTGEQETLEVSEIINHLKK